MPLQAGTWTANVGGTSTQIQINGVDSNGNVSGFVGDPAYSFNGLWDESSGSLTFQLSPVITGEVLSSQLYVGYLFEDSVNLTGVTGSVVFTLTGCVHDFLSMVTQNQTPPGLFGPAPSGKRSVFGWYAQIGLD